MNLLMPMIRPSDLAASLAVLRQSRYIDLTHDFESDIPHCESFPPEERITLYHYDEGVATRGTGFLAHEYRHVGQWGTHVDPPAHFVRGLRYLDEIDVSEMILPLAVIDIAERARANPDAVVAPSDITSWEAANGRLPDGVFVALHTGWDSHWPDKARMSNRDKAGVAHFPGWSAEVLAFLAKERQVTAIGHDTTDTDPGVVVSRREAPLENYWLRQNKWQIELLANLDQVPSAGALIVATPVTLVGMSPRPSR